jgi:hypothetical protein
MIELTIKIVTSDDENAEQRARTALGHYGFDISEIDIEELD